MEKVRDAWDKVDSEGCKEIPQDRVAALLEQLGEKCTKQELVLILRELGVGTEDNVAFSVFTRWYKEARLPQKGSKLNRLLVRDVAGRTRKPSHDLPPRNFSYGKAEERDAIGTAEVLKWEKEEKSSSKPRGAHMGQDRIAMNKAAIKSGCFTSKEFSSHGKDHVLLKKKAVPKKMMPASKQSTGETFGKVSVKSLPIKDLMAGELMIGHEEEEYPTHAIRKVMKPQVPEVRMNATAKMRAEQEEKEVSTWKMKKFANVSSKVFQ